MAPVIGASCHSVAEVVAAREQHADLVVFGPVFEKSGATGLGLERLREACRAAEGMGVFALGGVTAQNAAECTAAGAAGVAGIRLFQEGDIRRMALELRPQT